MSRSGHTGFFLDLSEELLAPVGRPTSDVQRERFMVDQANFREAHTRTMEAGDGASAVRFVRRLGRVINLAGLPLADSQERGLASLALSGATDADRAYALVRVASCACMLGEFDHARHLLSEAEQLFEVLGDQRGLADAVAWTGQTELNSLNLANAVALADRLTSLGEVMDDADITTWGRSLLGVALVYHAILDGDREAAERSRSLAEFNVRYAADSNWSSLEQANSVANLALSLYALGEYPASIATAQRSLHEMPRDIGAAFGMWPVFVVGLVVCESG